MADIELNQLKMKEVVVGLNGRVSPSETVHSQMVDLSFKNITYQIKVPNTSGKGDGPKMIPRVLLNNVSGLCPGGQMTAILGASGAGKTSLLNILAVRVGKGNGVTLTGELLANSKPYDSDKFASFASYIMQDDVLFSTLTPREAFQFVANLKFTDPKIKEKRVNESLKSLKLERCQHTLIGGTFQKGISGGERKRTSIGFELVSDPKVILLDEPTSGLDSFTAFSVINLLKGLCKEKNKTIVFTIHQPSSDIYELFDRIMLLVEGQFIYQGPKSNTINYFTQMGFDCPKYSNPTDYLMSIMHADSAVNRKNYQTYFTTYQEKLKSTVDLQILDANTDSILGRSAETSFLYQTSQICARAFINVKRDKLLVTGRLAQSIFMGLLVGGIYFGVASNHNGQKAIQSTAGVLFFLCIAHLMGALNPVMIQFPAERAVFLREENSKLYSAAAYFIGKSSVEIPFMIIVPVVQELISYWMIKLNDTTAEIVVIHMLSYVLLSLAGNSLGIMGGCMFQDVKVAAGVIPMMVMPLMLFSGFFKNLNNFLSWISWFQYLSPIKYAFEAVMRCQFTNNVSDIDPIAQYSLTIGMWESLYILIGFIIGIRILAFWLLVSLKSKMQ